MELRNAYASKLAEKPMPKDTRDVANIDTNPEEVALGKTAVLYRMALPDHLCPSGQKARWLLERQGYDVDDRLFRTRAEVEAFKAEHEVKTTHVPLVKHNVVTLKKEKVLSNPESLASSKDAAPKLLRAGERFAPSQPARRKAA